MKEQIKKFHESLGEIISAALHIESNLEFFISNYFVLPQTAKTFFFQDIILLKFDFETKVRLFEEISKKENFNQEEIKEIIKSIRYVQKIRNKIAHWQSEVSIEKEILIRNRKSITSEKDVFKIDKKIMDKVDEERQKAVKGIVKFYLNYSRQGTFETKTSLDLRQTSWDKVYSEVRDYVQKYKKLPPAYSRNLYDKKLGQWCYTQRKRYLENQLSSKEISLLEQLKGWYWDNMTLWMERYVRVKNYYEKYEKYPERRTVKKPFISTEEDKLGRWIKYNKDVFRGKEPFNKLNKEKIELLEKLPYWSWGKDDKWERNYLEVKKFAKKYKKLPRFSAEDKSEKKLGLWCSVQRGTYRGTRPNSKLNESQIKLLEKIPFWFWNKKKI